MIGDAGEDVGEPGLRVDVVELCGADRGVHERGALAAPIGAGEQPRLSTQSDAAQGTLGGVFVRQARPSSSNGVNAGQSLGM